LLPALRQWQIERGYPFSFATEASVDLAADQELMDLMAECRFESVFLGIETPDAASLETARKLQNTRTSLEESVEKITASGLRVMAGFIIGFDGEQRGAGNRIVEFVTRTGIPHAMMGMLQALPNTAMWTRLEQEGRLIQDSAAAKGVNQTNLLNFVPTRPIQDIATEYMEAFSTLYEPNAYIDRVYSYFLKLPPQRYKQILNEQAGSTARPTGKAGVSWVDLRALAIVVWRQGLKRNTRWRFWRALAGMARHNPARFKGFISILAHSEHFLEYRQIVRREIHEQLAGLPVDPSHSLMVAPPQMVPG
jgi:radical SAM superfamily enzyme YgiQ (UPF0313 family)